MVQSFVTISTEAGGMVNAPPDGLVTLYDNEGFDIRVEAAQVDRWLARGFSREAADPRGALDTVAPLHEACALALAALVDEAADGVLPEGAMAAAHAAISAVTDAYHAVILGVQRRTNPAPRAGVSMEEVLPENAPEVAGDVRGADGRIVRQREVDPGQVQFFIDQGWRLIA